MSVAAVMSHQDDPTGRELDQAVEAILGPPEGSDSLLRPIERDSLLGYIVEQKRVFATAGRAMRTARIQEEQKRLEHGIAHLPVGHPYREKPEARIAELKAQLAELDAQPIDGSGISIDTAVYRPTQDLSTAEEPAEADRPSVVLGTTGRSEGRSTGSNTVQVRVPPSGQAGSEADTSGVPDPSDTDRGKRRSAWVDAKRAAKKWTSDTDIDSGGGPEGFPSVVES